MLCVRLVLVSLLRCRRSGAWKQRAVEAKARTGLQQQRHAERSEGEPGVDASQIPLSLPSLPLCLSPHTHSFGLALQKNFLHALRRKKSQTGASNLYILAAAAAPISPSKSPRRSVAGRSKSLWFSEHFSLLWLLTGKKKDTTHLRYFLQPRRNNATQLQLESVCVCVCVCGCVFIFYLILPLFLYYRLHRGAIIQFLTTKKHHPACAGGDG